MRKSRQDFERDALPHLDALFAMGLRLTRNERDAEDLVQDVMLRAYRYWDRFEQGTNCKAWLFKIITNTFINRYHKGRREGEVVQAASKEAETDTQDILSHEVAASSRDPEGALGTRLLSDDVVTALAALPPEFRLAVLLSDVEEFSYKEIADIMECPVGTVMSRLHRGRKLLQRALHDYAVEMGIIKKVTRAEGEASAPIDLAKYRREKDQ